MYFEQTDCEGEASSVGLFMLFLYFSIEVGQHV
jgi:hypothetical protein